MRISMCSRDVNFPNNFKSRKSFGKMAALSFLSINNDQVISKRTSIDAFSSMFIIFHFHICTHCLTNSLLVVISRFLYLYRYSHLDADRYVFYSFLYARTVSLTSYSCSCHGLHSSPIGVYAVRACVFMPLVRVWQGWVGCGW